MHLIEGRLAIALGFSTAAHVGLAWVVGDDLRPGAAPAQRALSVAMAPAAPRAVLNAIAPSATASLAAPLAQPLEPEMVPVIDEPDEVVEARRVDVAKALDAPLARDRGPERTLHARASQVSPLVMALARETEMQITRARRRNALDKPLPAGLRAHAPGSARASPASRPPLVRAPAREVRGDPGAGRQAHAPSAVAGEPGAERSARPAAGNEPPKYPWSARLRGHQGRVVLSVWVGAGGEAERLAVLQSSGYASLDRAALAAVERWRFRPARRGGRDTGSLLYVPVVFRLDE